MMSKQTENILKILAEETSWKISLGYLISSSTDLMLSFNSEGQEDLNILYKTSDITSLFSVEEKVLIKSRVVEVAKKFLEKDKILEQERFEELGRL